jgi:hypothetical protein
VVCRSFDSFLAAMSASGKMNRDLIMTDKTILQAALKLPPKTRARLAGQLLDSLDESVWEETIVSGARLAEQRLRRLRTEKTKGIPEEEAHRRLFGKRKT